MAVAPLPQDIWGHILGWGGTLALCDSLGLSLAVVSATRIQRAVRDTIVLVSTLRPGDRLRVSLDPKRRRWFDGVVLSDTMYRTPIVQIVRLTTSKHYLFLPHSGIFLRYPCQTHSHRIKK